MLHAFALLSDFNLNPAVVVPVTTVTTVFLFVAAIVITKLYFRHRHRQMWHETARLALEKGQPLPPELAKSDALPPDQNRRRSDVRSGLILIAVGIALYLTWQHMGMKQSYYGAIPAFIGVALLLNGLFDAIRSGKSSAPDDQSGPK